MNSIIDLIISLSIWSVAKWLVIIALLIYLIFAFVVVRQVALMIKVVSGEPNWIIKIISWVHFFFALLVVVLALLIL